MSDSNGGDDDALIHLGVNIENAAGVSDLQARIVALLDTYNDTNAGTVKLTAEQTKLVRTLESLSAAADLISKGGLIQRTLAAEATAASRASGAFKQLEVDRTRALTSTDEGLRTELNSGNTDRIAAAAKVLQTDIARMTVMLREMENAGNSANTAAMASLTRELERAQANATAAQERLAEAQREAGIQRRLDSRATTQTVNERYQASPSGQAAQDAARAADVAAGEMALARSAAQAEDDARSQAADLKMALLHQQAQDEDRQRTLFQAQADRGDLLNATKYDPEFMANQQAANAARRGDIATALTPEQERAIAQANVDRRASQKRIKDQEDLIDPPAGQAAQDAARAADVAAGEMALARSAAQAEDDARSQAADLKMALLHQQAQDEDRQRTLFQAQADRGDLLNATKYDPEFMANQQAANAARRGDIATALTPEQERAIAQANVDRRASQKRIKDQEDLIDPPPPPPPKNPKKPSPEDPDYGGFDVLAFQARIQAQYMIINELFGAYARIQEQIIEFDKNMTNLGAVTGTSTDQLDKLRSTIIAISTATPFSANELAKTSTNLAEKGVSAGEITSALPNIANLAGATGSTLDQSGEIFSAAFENFKLTGAGSAAVADQLTVALNKTRLSAENFDQAILAGQEAAKTAGLSFTEMNAALGSMANQGLRSGALLGTALTAALTDLQDPPAKLAARFAELGIGTEQLDVKTNTLAGVLENLKAAGFTAADAYDTLGARQAKGLAALIDGAEGNQKLYTSMMNSSGAALVVSERMNSLANTYKALGNTMFGIAENATMPLLNALKETGSGFTELLSHINANSQGFKVMGTIIESLVAATALKWVTGLVGGFVSLTGVIEGATAAGWGLVSLFTMGSLGPAAIPVLGMVALTGAVYAAITSLSGLEQGAMKSAAQQKELEDRTKDATDKADAQAKSLEALNDFYVQSSNRSQELKSNSVALQNAVGELRAQFGNLTSSVFENISSYDGLMSKIAAVRAVIQGGLRADLTQALVAAQAQVASAQANLSGQSSPQSLSELSSGLGIHSQNARGGSNPVTDASNEFGSGSIQARAIAAAAKGDHDAMMQIYTESLTTAGLDDRTKKAIAAYATTTVTNTRSLVGAQGTVDDANAKLGVLNVGASPGYAALSGESQELFNQMKVLNGLHGEHSSDVQQKDLASVTQQIQSSIAGIEAYVKTLSAADQAAFKKTDLGKQVEDAQHKLNETAEMVTTNVTAEALKHATTQVAEASMDMELFKAEVEKSTGAAKDEAIGKYKAAALKLYNDQVTLLSADLKKQEKSGADIQGIEEDRMLKMRRLEEEYQRNLLAIVAKPRSGTRADPNRVIPGKIEDFAGEFGEQQSAINQSSTDSQASAKDGLAYQEAYLNTLKSQPGASKVDVKKLTDDLAKEKLAIETKGLADFQATIMSLTNLYVLASQQLQTEKGALDKMAADAGVKQLPNGDLDPTSGTFANERARADFITRYNAMFAQVTALQKRVMDIDRDLQGKTTQAAGLQGDIDARISVPAPSFTSTAQNALSDYEGTASGSNGGLFSLANEGNVIKGALDGAGKSLATFFENIGTGSMNAKQTFKAFATSMIKDMQDIVSQQLAKSIIGMIAGQAIGLLPGAGGAAATPDWSGAGTSADGGTGWYHGTSNTSSGRKHFDKGGMVPGADIGRDSVDATLAGGEAVLNHSATTLLGSNVIDRLNAGVLGASSPGKAPVAPQARQEMNVFVVDKSSVPQMGPRDVLAAVGEDIRNGGTTKKLIVAALQGG